MKYVLLLLFGELFAASSVIMIKASTIHPVLLASYRLLVSAFILLPFFFRELKKRGLRLDRETIRPSILPGIVLGLHFITWIAGARMTFAGNSTLIVNMAPAVMPLFLFALFRERISKVEGIGTMITMVGVVILASTDFRFSPGHFSGDVVCFVSMLLFTFYLCLNKRNNPKALLWVYLVPLYLIGGVFCFLVSFAFVNPFTAPVSTMDILMVAALALGPTMIGHSIMNFSMTVLRPQTVSLINLSQFVFAGIMGLIFFGEIPASIFYITSLFMVAGVAVIVLLGKRLPVASRKKA